MHTKYNGEVFAFALYMAGLGLTGVLCGLLFLEWPLMWTFWCAILLAASILAMQLSQVLYRPTWLLASKVRGFDGRCFPTWLNTNAVCLRFGDGLTGFFRLARKVPGLPLYYGVGEEFHGRVESGEVVTTELPPAWDDQPALRPEEPA